MKLKRIIIYPKDIQRITGQSERSARNMLTRIKAELNKGPHQMITIQEFSQFTGIDQEEVERFID